MKRRDFINGIKDGIPICLGYFSVSMAFGIAAANGGIPAWAAILTSLSNVTSAGQFAGIGVMLEKGGLLELAITTLIINMRYFLMSLSVSQKLSPSMSVPSRALISFGITDEIFAVSVKNTEPLGVRYMLGLILLPVIGWTAGTATGALATSILPASLSAAMGIALYGMFIAIVIPPAKENRNVLFAVGLSILLSVGFYYAPYLRNISSGWTIIIITLVVSALSATLLPISFSEEGGAE